MSQGNKLCQDIAVSQALSRLSKRFGCLPMERLGIVMRA